MWIYDCSNVAIDRGFYNTSQSPSFNSSGNGLYSWNDPGGIGWDIFPATPDNRLPNNPNVYVSVDFNIGYYSGGWSANRIRLNGHEAMNDLLVGNGYLAEFQYPISGCARELFDIEVKMEVGLGHQWMKLDHDIVSGTSDGDLNMDGEISVSDIVELSKTLNLCEADPEFIPCADYTADGCVNTSDVTEFSKIFYWYVSKSIVGGEFADEILLESTSENTMNCKIDSEIGWDVAVVQLFSPNGEVHVEWNGSGGFEDRSVLVPHGDGKDSFWMLYVFGPGAAGEMDLGVLEFGGNKSSGQLEVQNVILGGENHQDTKLPGKDTSAVFLFDAYPNPFNPLTNISFEIPRTESVSLCIYDVAGHLVKKLVSGQNLGAGKHEYSWDGTDGAGLPVSGGLYFYKLDAGDSSSVKRMTLIK